jgi:hypothetical protein
LARRVIVYVDGFNLYHSIAELKEPCLKWLNLWSLGLSLVGWNEQLVAVKYCSAFATWLPGPFARHRQYVRALECVGVQPIMGRFKQKARECNQCHARWTSHEEKETDVNIAIHLIKDVLTNQFDRAIVISADSDLVPAVNMAKDYDRTKNIDVVAPPKRFGHARDLKPIISISVGRIRKNLLPETLNHKDGTTITRPTEYDPPASSETP